MVDGNWLQLPFFYSHNEIYAAVSFSCVSSCNTLMITCSNWHNLKSPTKIKSSRTLEQSQPYCPKVQNPFQKQWVQCFALQTKMDKSYSMSCGDIFLSWSKWRLATEQTEQPICPFPSQPSPAVIGPPRGYLPQGHIWITSKLGRVLTLCQNLLNFSVLQDDNLRGW